MRIAAAITLIVILLLTGCTTGISSPNAPIKIITATPATTGTRAPTETAPIQQSATPAATRTQAPTQTTESSSTPAPTRTSMPTPTPAITSTATTQPASTKSAIVSAPTLAASSTAALVIVNTPTARPIASTATLAPVTQPTSAPVADTTGSYPCKPGQIKANRNSKIYHVPTGASYAKTTANVACYDSEAEAVAAGYRKAQR